MAHRKKDKDIPIQVLYYLGKRIFSTSNYLIILTHEDGKILNWQGDTDHFGYTTIAKITTIFQLNPVFKDIYEKKSFPVFLPIVKTPSNIKANFHLFKESRVIWVIFLESQFNKMVENNDTTLKQYISTRLAELISDKKHLIKTPLFTIEGMIELLIEREKDPFRIEKYQIIRDANREIIQTINNLLGDHLLPIANHTVPAQNGTEKKALLAYDQLKIIVAEDNQSHQIILKEMLKSLNCEPILVETGQALLAQLQRQPYHLILLDMRLQDKNGLELIREITRLENQNDAYIIIITTYCTEEQIVQINKAGADEVIIKPINKRILTEKINSYLQSRQFPAEHSIHSLDKDGEDGSQILPAKHQLKPADRDCLIAIIQELKDNLSIFDPENIIKASTRLTDLLSAPYLREKVKDFYRIAENFDDGELEEKINQLEQIIAHDTE